MSIVGAREAARRGDRKGDFLAGKYLLEDCLGLGGMGDVYRATNISLGRKVAIKVLSPEYVHIEEDVLRFLREARAAAAIRHANVVDVLDVARDDDGTPFIVEELLAGEDLERYLKTRGGRVSWEEALEIMIPVADAVAAAHAQDVVHRDLKPANIFLARERNDIVPKVLDFGACLFPTIAERSAKEARMLIGTPHYMAPEQIVSKAEVDARSDVWALGIILYEMIVGETPFEAESANAVMALVKTRDVPPLRERAKDAPADLEALVAECTKRDRRARIDDASAVREELKAIRRQARGSSASRMQTISESPSEPSEGSSIDPPAASARVPVRVPSLDRLPRAKLPPAASAAPQKGQALLELDEPLDEVPSAPLDLGARPSSWPPPRAEAAEPACAAMSSIPPVLDPRVAVAAPAADQAASPQRQEAGLSASVAESAADEGRRPTRGEERWSLSAATKLGALVVAPAAVASAAVLGIPAIAAPIARALRGDSTVASGVLAVAALVAAAALVARSVLGDRSRWLHVAAGAGVLFGIVMIIVTFSASEAAALGVPSSISGISTLVGPIAPLALGVRALARASASWLDPYGRAEAMRSAALASAMLALALVLSPLGVVRASPRPPGPQHAVAPHEPRVFLVGRTNSGRSTQRSSSLATIKDCPSSS